MSKRRKEHDVKAEHLKGEVKEEVDVKTELKQEAVWGV